MKSIKRFIETKLKVNESKSTVDRPWKRKFLGFSFYNSKDGIRIRIHEKSIKRFKDKVREVTNRNKGISMETRIHRLNQITTDQLEKVNSFLKITRNFISLNLGTTNKPNLKPNIDN